VKDQVGVIFAAILVCSTYAGVEFLKGVAKKPLETATMSEGVFVFNGDGNVYYCYKGGNDKEVWPVCKDGAYIRR